MKNEELVKEFRRILTEVSNNIEDPENDKEKELVAVFDFYMEFLSKEEQFSFFKLLMNELSYKNIIVDPETILAVGNVKLRTIFLTGLMTAFLIGLVGLFFGTTGVGGWVSEVATKLFYMFSL